jgi:hypothetical protein
MNTTENLISTGCPATAPQLINQVIKPVKFPAQPQEWKIVSLRECPTPDTMQHCETPEQAAAYWNTHIASHPYFNSECECLVVFILNTRRRIKGHYLVSIGTMDTILCHPREVFRLAIMASASAIIICHNHPSGVIPHPVLCRMRVGFAVNTLCLSIWLRHKKGAALTRDGGHSGMDENKIHPIGRLFRAAFSIHQPLSYPG